MTFPVTITHRSTTAKIYGRSKAYPFYRLSYSTEGRRHVRSFKTYSDAKQAAEKTVRAISEGNGAATTLKPNDVRALRFAREKLADLALALNLAKSDPTAPDAAFTLEDAVSEFVEAKRALGTSSRLIEAVRSHNKTAGSIRRIAVGTAIDEFLRERELKAQSKNGERAPLSAKYVAQERLRLDRVRTAFNTTDVCDIGRDHLDLFFSEHLKGLAARSRNHFRSTLHVWIKWCIRRDYLPKNHSLDRSEGLHPGGKAKESLPDGEIEIYTADEFARLIGECQGALVPVIAIAGLAGLRIAEVLRLSWEDVWRRPGFVEVTGRKAKTRQRRLVPVCEALASWLELYRDRTSGPVWDESEGERGGEWLFLKRRREAAERAKLPLRDNALRHSFASYRLALIHNEHQVAAEMGSSSQMLHQHYRQLATADEAKAWFNVRPIGAARNVVALPQAKEAAR